MKKILFFLFFVAAVLGVNAQDKKVTIKSAAASSYQGGEGADKAIDGRHRQSGIPIGAVEHHSP